MAYHAWCGLLLRDKKCVYLGGGWSKPNVYYFVLLFIIMDTSQELQEDATPNLPATDSGEEEAITNTESSTGEW